MSLWPSVTLNKLGRKGVVIILIIWSLYAFDVLSLRRRSGNWSATDQKDTKGWRPKYEQTTHKCVEIKMFAMPNLRAKYANHFWVVGVGCLIATLGCILAAYQVWRNGMSNKDKRRVRNWIFNFSKKCQTQVHKVKALPVWFSQKCF